MKVPVTGNIRITEGEKSILFYSNETSPMTRILFWEEDGFSFEFSQIFIELIKRSKTYMDIGANVGYYSLLAKTFNKDIKVYAFEPSNGPHYFFTQNILLNNFKDITLEKIALSDRNDTIHFFEERNPKFPYIQYHASGIGNTQNTWNISNYAKYEVSTSTLDEYITKHTIQQIDLIKMDTEGTEDTILSKAETVLKNLRPIIICEVLTQELARSIENILNPHGFLYFKFDEAGKNLSPVDQLSLVLDKTNRNFFFVPKEKKDMVLHFVKTS
jgi:FkbM family methyltransferase